MTKRYGLVGYPVKHSLSPAMQAAAFRHLGIDASYELFEIRLEMLGAFFSDFKKKLSGVNVTIPHKEAVLRHLDKITPPADAIGAVNTVALEGGLVVGYNTDVTGFIGALTDDLKFKPDNKKALILGAGGASRAAAFGLKSLDVKDITLTDLEEEKASSLAGLLNKAGCRAAAVHYDKKAVGELVYNSDLVINATPCGMEESDPELFDPGFLHKGLSVFDLIYNPEKTPLIREAEKRGCKAINGLGMLLYQGAEAFELWTGEKAPVDIMRKALKEALMRI